MSGEEYSENEYSDDEYDTLAIFRGNFQFGKRIF